MSNQIKQAFLIVAVICIVFAIIFSLGIFLMKTIDNENIAKSKAVETAKIVSANAGKKIELVKPVVRQVDTSCVMWNPVVYLVEIEGNKYIFARDDGYRITQIK